ncbi:MAG: hypothetical protein IKC01_00360 [Clostridia bacterium]|nr:hypothetical protein [Clostridia bacterium]
MLKIKNYKIAVISSITAFLFVFLYSVSFAASLQLNIWYALITSVICLIISISEKEALLAPNVYFAVPLLLILSYNTNALLPFCIITGAVLYALFSKKADFFRLHSSVLCGVTLGLAFSVTALLTTHYFGIGANGFTVIEILKNYRSLGFHPNWRGVFFGTITLFAMITYPFKFRKASKYFPAEAFSLLLPLILNLWLNPDKNSSPINETGNLFSLPAEFLQFFLPSLNTNFNFSFDVYLNCIFASISVACIMLIFKSPDERTDSRTTASVLTGITGGFPSSVYPFRSYGLISAVLAVLLTVFSYFLFGDILSRIPLHSAAVVLIMNAWKSVPFSDVAKTFKSGFSGIIITILIFVLFIFTNVFFALVAAIIINSLIKLKGGAEYEG